MCGSLFSWVSFVFSCFYVLIHWQFCLVSCTCVLYLMACVVHLNSVLEVYRLPLAFTEHDVPILHIAQKGKYRRETLWLYFFGFEAMIYSSPLARTVLLGSADWRLVVLPVLMKNLKGNLCCSSRFCLSFDHLKH